MKKILLLGASGYIGSVFRRVLLERDNEICINYIDHKIYTHFLEFRTMLRTLKPELVINAAAFIPKQSVSFCDTHQAETILGNAVFPAMLAQVCDAEGIPIAHISTGCLWSDGKEHSEDDPIQRAFTGHCGFYIGTKVLAEQEVRKAKKHYIWRIRLPFDEFDNDRNYLSKLAYFSEVWNHTNSISHRLDFVKACLDLWDVRAPFGTYHVTNEGSINVRTILDGMRNRGILNVYPVIFDNKPGDCKLSISKLLSTGVKMRNVNEAIEESLSHWVSR